MRNTVLDALRIILTAIVVNFHIRIIMGLYQGNILESYIPYAVPLFIVISFFFRSNKPVTERIKRLLVPFLFWSVAGCLINIGHIKVPDIIMQLVTGNSINTPLYYLILLVLFTLIGALIGKAPERMRPFLYVLLTISALVLQYARLNYRYFGMLPEAAAKSYGRIAELLPYMTVGTVFSYLYRSKFNNYAFLLVGFVFGLLFFLASRIPSPPGFHYSGVSILTGVISLFSLALVLSKASFPKIVNNSITFLGRYSFGVYLCHYPLLQLLVRLFPVLKQLMMKNTFIFLLVFLAASYLFCTLFDLITRRKLSYLVR